MQSETLGSVPVGRTPAEKHPENILINSAALLAAMSFLRFRRTVESGAVFTKHILGTALKWG
jgi:hypothetical protein